MDEITEQYINAKKWKKSMLIAMTAMMIMAAALIVCGFVIKGFLVFFLISGGIVAVVGAAAFIMYSLSFNKMDRMVRKFLSDNGKTEEEINSLLGGKEK